MMTHNRITFRQTLFAVIFLLAFLAITVFLFTFRADEHRFTQISSRLFLEEMTANTLNMHYTLAYPANFGIHDYEAVLPCYSQENRLAGQAQTENILAALRQLNPDKLNTADRYTRQLLIHFLDTSLTMSGYPYYSEPLSPASGMQSQLPILLAEYTFRSRRDVEDYLDLLDQTDEYFASLLLFEQEKAQAGLLMPAISLEKVRKQCDTILTEEELENGSHFLQTTFKERIQALYSSGGISREDALFYLTQNDRLLKTVMLPAYEALSDGLFVLKDESISLGGLASRQDGRSYYEYLLISETGSARPVEEIKKLLSSKFTEEYQAIRELLTQYPQLASLDYVEELAFSFPYQKADQMLSDLQLRMRSDFPALDTSAQALPAVTVKSVSSSLQDYCAPAFYLTPPLDDTSANVIYINEKTTPSGLELYTTLAHEGYPGHMYQSVFSNRTQMNIANSNIREILWYGGYQEGWALYVEFISYDYATELMTEANKPELAAAVQLEKHNRSLQLCLYSLLDIMIHYDGASYSQVAKVLDSFGITQSSSVAAVYEYIAEEPCNYLKYYLGYLEILALQQKAVRLWGDGYSALAFHTFFLECGPSDFASLEQALKQAEKPGKIQAGEAKELSAAWRIYAGRYSGLQSCLSLLYIPEKMIYVQQGFL